MSAIITRVMRNISSVAQLVSLPVGTKRIVAQYRDSGVAGPVRMVFEAASALDGAHRLTRPECYMAYASGQQIPEMSFAQDPVLYVMTDSAIGAGSNTLTLSIEVT